MTRTILPLILAFCLGLPPGLAAGAGRLMPGMNALSLSVDGRTRTARVALPRIPPQPVVGWPLVLMLHGAGGSAEEAARSSGWDRLGERDGFVTAYPEGTAADETRPARGLRNARTWNSGQATSLAAGERSATAKEIDDVAFLSALIGEIRRRADIDPRRIYVVGHSNGTTMAYRFGVERPDLVAAVGAVAGHFEAAARPLSSPVSLLQIVGDRDPFTPLSGGEAGILRRKTTVPPALESSAKWAGMLGLAGPPQVLQDDARVKVQRWGPDARGAEVRAVIVKGQGHTYPMPGRTPRAEMLVGPSVDFFDASEAFWQFFLTHPKP